MEDIFPVQEKSIREGWAKNKPQEMVFFPSSSDIFYENIADYISVCKKIINAGHEVFFTTKPTLKQMNEFIRQWDLDKSKIQIFITISTDDDEALRIFEPYTSFFDERIQVIKRLLESGFNVNVMMEPFLTEPVSLLKNIRSLVQINGIFAVGAMNYTKNIQFFQDQEMNELTYEYLELLNSKKNHLDLWDYAKDDAQIYLKHHSIDIIMRK